MKCCILGVSKKIKGIHENVFKLSRCLFFKILIYTLKYICEYCLDRKGHKGSFHIWICCTFTSCEIPWVPFFNLEILFIIRIQFHTFFLIEVPKNILKLLLSILCITKDNIWIPSECFEWCDYYISAITLKLYRYGV